MFILRLYWCLLLMIFFSLSFLFLLSWCFFYCVFHSTDYLSLLILLSKSQFTYWNFSGMVLNFSSIFMTTSSLYLGSELIFLLHSSAWVLYAVTEFGCLCRISVYVLSCVQGTVYSCVCAQRPEFGARCFSLSFSTLFIETRSLNWIKSATNSASLAGYPDARISCLHFPQLGLSVSHWHPNSNSYA